MQSIIGKEQIYRCADHADPEAGGERCSVSGAMLRARDEQRDLLQLEQQVRGDGRVADITDEGAGGGERAHQANIYMEVSMQCDLLKGVKKSDSRV